MTLVIDKSIPSSEIQQKILDFTSKIAEKEKESDFERMLKARQNSFGKAFLKTEKSPLELQKEWRDE